ncbi:M48 family peptidase, partial [Chloroflexota bacterium]
MNPFFVIILTAILLEFAINLVADLLNLKALKLEIPDSLKGIYKRDEYRNSQQYTRTVTRFAFVTSSFRLALLLVFWFAGGFNYLDQIIRSWGFVPIANGLLYVGIPLFAYSLVNLPFSIYATFVIEERFGFNRTTPVTFIKDILKGLALALILGAPLLAIVLA